MLPFILFFSSCATTIFDPEVIQGCVDSNGAYIGYASVIGCSSKDTVYYCKLPKDQANEYNKGWSRFYSSLDEFNNSSQCSHTGGTTYKNYTKNSTNDESESLSDRLKDPPGLRDLSDRDICIKHFTNKVNNDWLNKTLTDAAIKKRSLDCSVYAAEENNILLKKELNKKIKCWAVDDYVRCYSY